MTEGEGVIENNAKGFVISIELALKAMFKIEISVEEAKKIRKWVRKSY
ncbi:hypothetical protein [Wolbachia endosymbiont of Litomosoides sigmodontis]|nr:hypothetical protein [Wolbachia endosymbiont of Litomosoides sigmodontis]